LFELPAWASDAAGIQHRERDHCPARPRLTKGSQQQHQSQETRAMSRFDKLSDQEQARLKQAARKAGASSLPFILFKDGGFITGKKPDEVDLVGVEFVALIDLASAGWTCFMHNRLLDSVMVDLLQDSMPPRPATLTDQVDWKVGTYGVLIFKARSEPTRKLVAELLADFIRTRRRPIIRLLVEQEPRRTVPKFYIIGHDESDDADALMTAKRLSADEAAPSDETSSADSITTTTTTNGATRSHRNADMDDDIPF
jgi:hypothetical protein